MNAQSESVIHAVSLEAVRVARGRYRIHHGLGRCDLVGCPRGFI